MGPPLVPGLASLGISNAAIYAFASALQEVVVVGGLEYLPSPSPAALSEKVVYLLLIQLCFSCDMLGHGDLLPIWEEVDRVKGCTEGLDTQNKVLLRGVPSCYRVFRGRVHFSASLLQLPFVNNIFLWNPSLDPS